MRAIFLIQWIRFIFLSLLSFAGYSTLNAKDTIQGHYTGKVVVLEIGSEDLMLKSKFNYLSKQIRLAEEQAAEAIVLNLDTPGGLAWETTEVMMTTLQNLKVPVISYVNPRAMSAGALIAIATGSIYMAPVSSIGAAAVVKENAAVTGEDERAKMTAAMRSMARATAKAKGHRQEVVEAMVDRSLGLKIGEQQITAIGQLCALDQEQATQVIDGIPVLAKAIAGSLQDVVAAEQFKGGLLHVKPNTWQSLISWIIDYPSLLISLGLAALFIEMKTPGFGFAGAFALLMFGLFFAAHVMGGIMENSLPILLFVLGIVFILVDIFLMPGVFFLGIVGGIMMLSGLLATMIGWGGVAGLNIVWMESAFLQLCLALLGSIAIIWIAISYLPKTDAFQRINLSAELTGGQASIEGEGQAMAVNLKVGDRGVTVSALRPYGQVDFSGVSLEALVQSGYLPNGIPVEIARIDRGRIVVKAV